MRNKTEAAGHHSVEQGLLIGDERVITDEWNDVLSLLLGRERRLRGEGWRRRPLPRTSGRGNMEGT